MRAADAPLVAGAALVFVASAALTVYWSAAMPPMAMDMPGGWTMSMTWMRMPGQGWAGATVSFVAMWSVMMVAMMLPAFVPMLMRYRDARPGAAPIELLAVGAGYFGAWAALGLACWPVGVAVMHLAMRDAAVSRAIPLLSAATLLLAGAWQLTRWKFRELARCRDESHRERAPCCAARVEEPPLHHGWRLGLRCLRCCAPLTLLLLVMGAMDLVAMIGVTAAISLERLAPRGERWARVIGFVVLLAGLSALVRALE
ncbi:MAG TPA: DUF2182 domain-containing protein [Steroidobacteraceae bacterium]|nr:DUF2182 domain-containing protein [Steroidobacteraceae bacterium]